MINAQYFTLVKPHQEHCAQFWSSKFKRDDKIGVIRWLRILNYKERLMKMGLFNLENGSLAQNLIMFFHYRKEKVRE